MFEKLANFIEKCILKIVIFITNYLPVKVIRDENGTPFLYRYHIFNFGNDGPGICIHHFVKSDPDRGYHDHPWLRAMSFILCGGYEERILNNHDALMKNNILRPENRNINLHPEYDVYKRKRWTFNYLDGVKNFHRVIIDEENGIPGAWTIFFFGSRSKTWGMISLYGEYKAMSETIKDADGGWWNHVGTGYGVDNHVKHEGNVIATVDIGVIAGPINDQHILLIKRGKEPFKGMWALPGGRIEQKDSDILEAAKRELKEETQLENVTLKYITTVGNSNRDPRGFCLTNIFVTNLDEIPKGVRAGDDAVDYKWFPINELPEMAFDHHDIIFEYLV